MMQWVDVLEKIITNIIPEIAKPTADFVFTISQNLINSLETDEEKALFVPKILPLMKTAQFVFEGGILPKNRIYSFKEIIYHIKKIQDDPVESICDNFIHFIKATEIKNYFLSLNEDEQEKEIVEIINFLKEYGFHVYPYESLQKYNHADIEVFYDESNENGYVLVENKRLYFPCGWKTEQIKGSYNTLRMEQDMNSPHRYETPDFSLREGDVIADVGAAEGIWALRNVENASKVFLFECDPGWCYALQKTFEPWKEKVIIVNKYVSNIVDYKNTTMDEIFRGQRIDFIKADIEGFESKMLIGSKEILKNNNNLNLLLCTYHGKDDAANFKELLEKCGFITEFSKGYMLCFYYHDLKEPYIRRGVIRAKK